MTDAEGTIHVVQVPRRFVRHHWGGTETVVQQTSAGLMKLGHGTEVITSSALSESGIETFEGLRVSRYPYFYPYWGLSDESRGRMDQLGGNMFSFSLLRALLRMPKLDLIHLHTMGRLGGIGRYAARKRGIPYVVSLHGGVLDVPADQAEALLEPTKGAWEWGKVLGWWVGSRRVLEDAAAIICVGKAEQRLIQQRYPRQRVEYLPNGVDPSRFAQGNRLAFRDSLGIPAEARVLLTVARIAPQKNQRLAIETLPAIRAKDPRVHWVLIGPVTDERYYLELKRSTRESGLDGCLHFVEGYPPGDTRLVDAYHGADLFVLPSTHEPFGIVILEAWAAGLPVLASRVGGLPFFVADGVDGILFDPASPDDLTAKYLALSSETTMCMAEQGRAKVLKEYTWDKITERLCTLYQEVLHGRPSHAAGLSA